MCMAGRSDRLVQFVQNQRCQGEKCVIFPFEAVYKLETQFIREKLNKKPRFLICFTNCACRIYESEIKLRFLLEGNSNILSFEKIH